MQFAGGWEGRAERSACFHRPMSGDTSWAVRDLAAEDWLQVLDLLLSVYVGEGFSDVQWANPVFSRIYLEAQGDVLVAVGPVGKILGVVLLLADKSELRQISLEGEAEFRILAVSSAARGRGIGKSLVRECLARAKRGGARRMVLSTQQAMHAAQALYKHLGFSRQPDRDWRTSSGRSMLAYSLTLEDC